MKIGDRVRVHARTHMAYVENKRKVHREKFNTKGWVVGATYRCVGTYTRGYLSRRSLAGHGLDEYEPAYLKVTRKVFVYRVSEGLTRKPFDVLPCDLTIIQS